MTNHFNVVALGVSLIGLSACVVGPDFRRPTGTPSAAYLEQSAINDRNTDLPAQTTSPWWQQFDDELLTQYVALALAQNLDLAQAIARVTQAKAGLRSATAALLPSGAGVASATRAGTSEETPIGQVASAQPGFLRTENVFEADAQAGWELDLFGGLRRGRESSRALYEAARVDVAAAQLAVAAQTADTYIVIRGLQTRIAITQEQTEKQRQLLSLVELQFAKGVAAALQVEQAQGSLAQVEATLPALSAQLDSALNALDILLGSQPGADRADFVAVKPIPGAPRVAAAGGPADLIRRRPDLVVAERRLEASNARVGQALAEYYPKFSLSGLIGTATVTSNNVFSDGARQWQGAFGLRWRLFDFARVDAEVSAARGRNAELLASYRLSVLRATEDVENAFSQLVNDEQQERALARGELALTQARDASVIAYRNGAVSLIEVLDADTRLLGTRDARARAQTQSARAAVASFRALGGGWDAEDAKLAADARPATSGRR